jgi:hypothetical protein
MLTEIQQKAYGLLHDLKEHSRQRPSRALSLAITKMEEAIHRLDELPDASPAEKFAEERGIDVERHG